MLVGFCFVVCCLGFFTITIEDKSQALAIERGQKQTPYVLLYQGG